MLVTPRRPFPAGAKVTLRAQAGLSSQEGPLPSLQVAARSFQVYVPLRVKVLCDGRPLRADRPCWPMSNPYHGGLSLEFSEPVCGRQLLRGLRLTPGNARLARHLRTHWPDGVARQASKNPCARQWSLGHDLALRRAHRLTLSPGLRDVFGQRLGRGSVDARFTTRGLPPDIFMPSGRHGLREPWHPYAVKTVNVTALQARITPYRGAARVALLECLRRNPRQQCARRAGGAFATIKQPGRRDRVERRVLKLPGTLSVVTLRSPQVVGPDSSRPADST